MVDHTSFIGMIFSLVLSILGPLGVLIWFRMKYQASLLSFFVGAAAFFIAVQCLEGPLNVYLLSLNETTATFLKQSPFIFAIYGGLMAGLFEETARLISFKVCLKKQTRIQDGLAYGIGHGGIEAILFAGMASVNNLIIGFLINQQRLDTLQLPPDIANLVTTQLVETPPALFFVSGIERLLTLVIHMALSLLVFNAVKYRRYGYYGLAIFLHMMLNIPAAFYQLGYLNIWLVEGYVLLFSIGSILYIIKSLKAHQSELRQVEDEELTYVKAQRY